MRDCVKAEVENIMADVGEPAREAVERFVLAAHGDVDTVRRLHRAEHGKMYSQELWIIAAKKSWRSRGIRWIVRG